MPKNLINDETYEFAEGTEKSEHTALADRVTAAEDEISSLDGRLTTAEENITSLGTTVSENSSRITTLEGKTKNITISSNNPSGGANGDIWIKVT